MADTKTTALTASSGLAAADLLYVVDDPGGTPASQKATFTQVLTLIAANLASLGLGTGNSPQFTAINLGHASDTTITRVSAGVVAVEGSNVLLASGLGSVTQAYDADLATLATAFSSASASGPASLALHEDTDNGTNKVTLIAPASVASDKTATLQDVTGTIYVTGGTDVSLADGGTGASLADPNADRIMFWDDSAGATAFLAAGSSVLINDTTVNVRECLVIAVGDETTAITTGTAKVTFRTPYAFTVTSVKASLTTASSSGNPAVDINEGGASIFSTTLTIDANELTSTTAATAAVISDASLAADALMTIDIDTAGTGAKGLKIYLIGYQT